MVHSFGKQATVSHPMSKQPNNQMGVGKGMTVAMYIDFPYYPEALGGFNGRPDLSIRRPRGVWGLFEGPKFIGSLWVQKFRWTPHSLYCHGENVLYDSFCGHCRNGMLSPHVCLRLSGLGSWMSFSRYGLDSKSKFAICSSEAIRFRKCLFLAPMVNQTLLSTPRSPHRYGSAAHRAGRHLRRLRIAARRSPARSKRIGLTGA